MNGLRDVRYLYPIPYGIRRPGLNANSLWVRENIKTLSNVIDFRGLFGH